MQILHFDSILPLHRLGPPPERNGFVLVGLKTETGSVLEIHIFLYFRYFFTLHKQTLISMYQAYTRDNRESFSIMNVQESDYYFDGEKLYRNVELTISNFSYVPISIVAVEIGRIDSILRYDSLSLDDLPLNLERNYSENISIPWCFDISEEDRQSIFREFGSNTMIDTYILDVFLSAGEIVSNDSHVSYNYLRSVKIWTVNGGKAVYERGGGASATF